MIKDLVSILVPVYNVENYLNDCFKSLENQTYKNIEIIFLNDGSNDKSLELLNEFKSKHNNVKVYSQENVGLAATRNKLYTYANGEYIYMFDSDDMLHPDTINFLVNTLKTTNVDLISGYSKFVKEDLHYDQIKWKSTKHIKTKNIKSEKLIKFLTDEFFGSYCRTHAKIYRTSILKQIPEFPNITPSIYSLGEDFYLLTSYLRYCKSAALVKFKFHYYRMRKSSILHTTNSFNPKTINLLNADEKFYATPHTKSELNAMKAKKGFHAVGILWYMRKGKYDNVEEVLYVYNVLKENIKYFYNLKYHRFYYIFLPIMVLFFKPYIKRVKKSNIN